MEKPGFNGFTRKIYIKAPPEKLYACWATPKGICSWFLLEARYSSADGKQRVPEEQIQPGDRYTWKWHNWNGQEEGQIVQANGKDFLEFSFAGVSTVSVKLEDRGQAVLVTLQQYGIPTDEESKLNIHFGCSNGWTFWLANLKAYLEHGILLNETKIDLTNEPLASFEFVNM